MLKSAGRFLYTHMKPTWRLLIRHVGFILLLVARIKFFVVIPQNLMSLGLRCGQRKSCGLSNGRMLSISS